MRVWLRFWTDDYDRILEGVYSGDPGPKEFHIVEEHEVQFVPDAWMSQAHSAITTVLGLPNLSPLVKGILEPALKDFQGDFNRDDPKNWSKE